MIKGQNNLQHPNFNEDLMGAVQGLIKVWVWGKHMPWVLTLLAKTPTWLVKIFDSQMAGYMIHQEVRSLLYS